MAMQFLEGRSRLGFFLISPMLRIHSATVLVSVSCLFSESQIWQTLKCPLD